MCKFMIALVSTNPQFRYVSVKIWLRENKNTYSTQDCPYHAHDLDSKFAIMTLTFES